VLCRQVRDHLHESTARRHLLALTLAIPTRADPPKLALFDFELLATSLQGEMNGPRRDEHERLMGPAINCARNWQSPASSSCSIFCQSKARRTTAIAGLRWLRCALRATTRADLYITGVVQKVSELILS